MATFSEDMLASTTNGNTFKLFKKGSTTQITAAVSYEASTDTATLSPNRDLTGGVTYKAVVTTGAKDLADNALDQNSSTAGSQQMMWLFTVSNFPRTPYTKVRRTLEAEMAKGEEIPSRRGEVVHLQRRG
jgi:hypothetical protein